MMRVCAIAAVSVLALAACDTSPKGQLTSGVWVCDAGRSNDGDATLTLTFKGDGEFKQRVENENDDGEVVLEVVGKWKLDDEGERLTLRGEDVEFISASRKRRSEGKSIVESMRRQVGSSTGRVVMDVDIDGKNMTLSPKGSSEELECERK